MRRGARRRLWLITSALFDVTLKAALHPLLRPSIGVRTSLDSRHEVRRVPRTAVSICNIVCLQMRLTSSVRASWEGGSVMPSARLPRG